MHKRTSDSIFILKIKHYQIDQHNCSRHLIKIDLFNFINSTISDLMNSISLESLFCTISFFMFFMKINFLIINSDNKITDHRNSRTAAMLLMNYTDILH